jgi:hypothetical protein
MKVVCKCKEEKQKVGGGMGRALKGRGIEPDQVGAFSFPVLKSSFREGDPVIDASTHASSETSVREVRIVDGGSRSWRQGTGVSYQTN